MHPQPSGERPPPLTTHPCGCAPQAAAAQDAAGSRGGLKGAWLESMVYAATPDEQRELLGNRLFYAILSKLAPATAADASTASPAELDTAGAVTGMLLEQVPLDEQIQLATDSAALADKLAEALGVLQQHGQYPAGGHGAWAEEGGAEGASSEQSSDSICVTEQPLPPPPPATAAGGGSEEAGDVDMHHAHAAPAWQQDWAGTWGAHAGCVFREAWQQQARGSGHAAAAGADPAAMERWMAEWVQQYMQHYLLPCLWQQLLASSLPPPPASAAADAAGAGTPGGEAGAPPCSVPLEVPLQLKKEVPDCFCCPIELAVFDEPVVASDGHTYERSALLRWLHKSPTSPLTGERLDTRVMVANVTLKKAIDAWRSRR